MRAHRIACGIVGGLAALLTVAAPPPAHAQGGPSQGVQVELGVFGGYHLFADDLELGVLDHPGFVSYPKSAPAIGVRAGLTVLPWVSFEGEVAGLPTKDDARSLAAFILAYRVHALAHLLSGNVKPFVLIGTGLVQVATTDGNAQSGLDKDTDGEVHAGLGVKWDVTPRVQVRFDARAYMMPNTKEFSYSPDYEALLGVAFKLPFKKAPPPPPPQDSDGDGVYDHEDKCPDEPEDKDGFQDGDGCPDPDNDGDGIPDARDKCPDAAETPNGIDDDDGCPETDEDGDGLFGSADRCPTEPEDKDGFQDDDGCPDPDNDNDGVDDDKDRCPTEAETRNGFQDDDGCPDDLPKEVRKFTGVIKGINFKPSSADIQRRSFKLLGEAVKVLKEYGSLRVEISGHTSSEGNPQKNTALSQKRAEAVRAYLVSAGIEGERIQAIGFGSDRPIAPNATRKGRTMNRRIEFRLLTD